VQVAGNVTCETGVPVYMSHVTELSDATFDETVLGADRPVLVDFTAEWCGPCKVIAPLLEELAVELADRLSFAKIDVDANPKITMRYEVMSMPTLILFEDGQPTRRLVGARGKNHLLQELDAALEPA
jgi:thioredoxin 1